MLNPIKHTRKKLGMTQSQFASFMRVSPRTVRYWEASPPPGIVHLVCWLMDEYIITKDDIEAFWSQQVSTMSKSVNKRNIQENQGDGNA